METKLIELEDLQIGDEIVISCQSHFKYLRVLSQPQENGNTHYYTKKPLYKSVRCSTKRIDKQHTYTNARGISYTRTEKHWDFTPDDHNVKLSLDLNYKQILLINRPSEF